MRLCALRVPPPGRKRAAAERNIWGFLTAETATPFLEVDFIGPDALETVLGRCKADSEAMSKGKPRVPPSTAGTDR